MATAIKVCAGAAHYITYQPTGGTLYTMPYKNLTDNVVPREISVQASGALTPETVVLALLYVLGAIVGLRILLMR